MKENAIGFKMISQTFKSNIQLSNPSKLESEHFRQKLV